jgi:hypothetical protein
MKRKNVISQNRRLNCIALNNNKNLMFKHDNLNTLNEISKKDKKLQSILRFYKNHINE